MPGMLESIFEDLSYAKVWWLVAAAFTIFYVVNNILKDARIRKLGHRAPQRSSYLPFGLDIMYSAVKAALKNQSLEFFEEGLTKFGNPNRPLSVEFTIGSQRIIMTADDVNIKAILATQFNDYGKGEEFRKDWHDFLGNSIFTTDGELWHNARQLIRPQFVKDRLSDIKTFEKHVQILLPMLGGQGKDKDVDVLDLFFRYTLDAATDFLLGRSVGSMEHNEVAFARAFNSVQHIQSIIARTGNLNWLVPRREFYRELKVLNDFVEPYIEQVFALSASDLEKHTKSDVGYTFLHAISGYTKDRTMIRDQLVAILLAGRDTTACTLSWLFYELSQQPRIVEKLRTEILDRVGRERTPTYEDLKSMKYLQHCINETLRKYPIVPFNVRLALKDTTLPHGGGPDGLQPLGVLKGTPVGYSTLAMQRRQDLYPPPSAEFPPIQQFVPERWDSWTPKSWTYIPFNGGPRICIGQQFALTEMAYTITRIFQRYERVENRMSGDIELKTDIVLQPANGVQLAFY